MSQDRAAQCAGDGDSPGLSHREREDRVRQFQQQQAEEAARRRDELSRQEEQMSRQLEQAEQERRRRYRELGQKDAERRSQAEERRRQMEEQDQERRGAILRRNQEREAMLENKRLHQTGSILLGFGSAAPRWESPGDMGKRWTSASQIDGAGDSRPEGKTAAAAAAAAVVHTDLTSARLRGQAMRMSTSMFEILDWVESDCEESSRPAAARHRPTRRSEPGPAPQKGSLRPQTASGSDSSPVKAARQLQAASSRSGVEEPSARRHRSDLTPTTPGRSFRDPPPPQPQRRRSPVVSGAATPTTPSRPGSALSQQSSSAAGRGVALRARGVARRPRPVSIAGIPSRPTADNNNKPEGEGRPQGRGSSLSQTPRRPIPSSAPASEARRSAAAPSPSRRTPAQVKAEDARKKKQRSKSGTPQPRDPQPEKAAVSPPARSEAPPSPPVQPDAVPSEPETQAAPPPATAAIDGSTVPEPAPTEEVKAAAVEAPTETSPSTKEKPAPEPGTDEDTDAGGRRQAGYTSEAAAKAALAEKRRKVREEAERRAELERLRLEQERQKEEERLRAEEQAMEEASRAEQERLQRAIQEAEAERREEAERRAAEEEQRLRREEEEAAAREEAEKARVAAAEKAAQEEVERKKRRSRVAEIMSRTRTSVPGNSSSPPTEEEMNAANDAKTAAALEAGSGPSDEASATPESVTPNPTPSEAQPDAGATEETDKPRPESTDSSVDAQPSVLPEAVTDVSSEVQTSSTPVAHTDGLVEAQADVLPEAETNISLEPHGSTTLEAETDSFQSKQLDSSIDAPASLEPVPTQSTETVQGLKPEVEEGTAASASDVYPVSGSEHDPATFTVSAGDSDDGGAHESPAPTGELPTIRQDDPAPTVEVQPTVAVELEQPMSIETSPLPPTSACDVNSNETHESNGNVNGHSSAPGVVNVHSNGMSPTTPATTILKGPPTLPSDEDSLNSNLEGSPRLDTPHLTSSPQIAEMLQL